MEYVGHDTRLNIGTVYMELLVHSGENRRVNLSVLTGSGEYEALVTGDLTAEEELGLLARLGTKSPELLVAGDHGGKTSCSESFLRSLGGETAVVSVGFNYQGCPAEETLERMEFCGYNVYRTDLDGTVEIRISA